MSTKKNKKMIGGIPIYPGGYSCVFKPQLKCKTNTRKIKSDLMKQLQSTEDWWNPRSPSHAGLF